MGVLGFTVTSFATDQSQVQRVLAQQDALAAAGAIVVDYHVTFQAGQVDSSERVSTFYDAKRYVSTTKTPSLENSEWTDGVFLLKASRDLKRERQGLVIGDPGEVKRDPWACPRGIGPLFVEGRGLSKLKDMRVEQRDGKVILTGSDHGRNVRAELDPGRKYLATQIQVLDHQGEPRMTYRNTAYREVDGYVYAAASAYHSLSGIQFDAKLVDRQVADRHFVTPNWLIKEAAFADHRVSPGVGYSYADLLRLNGGKEPSLEDLLRISNEQRGKLDARRLSDRERSARIAESRAHDRLVRIIQIVVGGLAAIALLLLGRSLSRK